MNMIEKMFGRKATIIYLDPTSEKEKRVEKDRIKYFFNKKIKKGNWYLIKHRYKNKRLPVNISEKDFTADGNVILYTVDGIKMTTAKRYSIPENEAELKPYDLEFTVNEIAYGEEKYKKAEGFFEKYANYLVPIMSAISIAIVIVFMMKLNAQLQGNMFQAAQNALNPFIETLKQTIGAAKTATGQMYQNVPLPP